MSSLEALARSIHETTTLEVLEGDSVLTIAYSDAPEWARPDRPQLAAPRDGSGQVLLASQPEREVIRLSKIGFTPYTSQYHRSGGSPSRRARSGPQAWLRHRLRRARAVPSMPWRCRSSTSAHRSCHTRSSAPRATESRPAACLSSWIRAREVAAVDHRPHRRSSAFTLSPSPPGGPATA